MNIPSVRYSLRQDCYVPQVNGTDLPITTFDEARAWRIANAQALLSHAKEKLHDLEVHSAEYAELKCAIQRVEKDASEENIEHLGAVLGIELAKTTSQSC